MILYQQAKRMCAIEQAAKNEIVSSFSGQTGKLRFGVTPSLAGGAITATLMDFAQRYPQTEIKYLEASPADLCKMLQNGIIEAAALKTVSDLPENVKPLCIQEDPTVVLYRPDLGFLEKVKRDTVTISQLSDVPIATEELYQGPVAAAFKAKNAKLYLKSLSSDPAVSVRMAQAGLAVALVSSRAAAALQDQSLAVKPVSESAGLSARYCLLVQQGNYRSQVVNNFLAMLGDALGIDLSAVLPPQEEPAED